MFNLESIPMVKHVYEADQMFKQGAYSVECRKLNGEVLVCTSMQMVKTFYKSVDIFEEGQLELEFDK